MVDVLGRFFSSLSLVFYLLLGWKVLQWESSRPDVHFIVYTEAFPFGFSYRVASAEHIEERERENGRAKNAQQREPERLISAYKPIVAIKSPKWTWLKLSERDNNLSRFSFRLGNSLRLPSPDLYVNALILIWWSKRAPIIKCDFHDPFLFFSSWTQMPEMDGKNPEWKFKSQLCKDCRQSKKRENPP